MAAASLDGPGAPRLEDRVFDSTMRAFNDLAARPIQHACKRTDCSHLYTSEVLAAEAAARERSTPLSRERTEGDADQLETYAFGPDKVITFDGTFFPNASAMRDAKESGLHSITEPGPGAPTVGGGFTPLSVGELWPSDAPRELIDCKWKYRNGLSELTPAVRAAAMRWCNFRKAPKGCSNVPLTADEFLAMRAGLPKNVQALVDLVTESAPCTARACRACERVPKRPWMGTGLVSHQIIYRIRTNVGKAHELCVSQTL
jgi:hypothetical protein